MLAFSEPAAASWIGGLHLIKPLIGGEHAALACCQRGMLAGSEGGNISYVAPPDSGTWLESELAKKSWLKKEATSSESSAHCRHAIVCASADYHGGILVA